MEHLLFAVVSIDKATGIPIDARPQALFEELVVEPLLFLTVGCAFFYLADLARAAGQLLHVFAEGLRREL